MDNVTRDISNHMRGVQSDTDRTRQFVSEMIRDARLWAQAASRTASESVNDLGDFRVGSVAGSAPVAPTVSVDIQGAPALPEISPTSFGEVTFTAPPRPNYKVVAGITGVSIKPFESSVGALLIPDAPATSTFVAPSAPQLIDVSLPTKPTLERPLFPTLDALTVPEFDFSSLPTFTDLPPEFVGTDVSTVLQWSEATYKTEVIDDVIAVLRDMWAGNRGIPVAVEQAMWERAAEREDLDLQRALKALDVEYAARGFEQPPGVLADKKQSLREESLLRKQTANRDIAIRMAEIQIDNIKFACEQGVAAENVYYNIWSNMVQRQFEAAKIQMDAQLQLLTARIAVFNAQQQGYATRASVWKSMLDAQLQVYRTQLEAEQTKGTLNELRVRVYAEHVRALLSDVEIYKAEMDGARLVSDMNRNLIAGYGEEVSAFAAKINADRVRFDAYDARVRGELGKAQVMDAEARAYAAYVSGQSSLADLSAKRADVDIRTNELFLRQYLGDLDAAKATMESSVAAIRASADAYTADTQRYIAQSGAESDRFKVELAAQETEARIAVSVYEAAIRRYAVDVEELVKTASLQLEALKASGQVASTVAAGAMAGMHVGATMSGSVTAAANAAMQASAMSSKAKNYNANLDIEEGGPVPSSWND